MVSKEDIARMLVQLVDLMEITGRAMRQHPGLCREHGKELLRAAQQAKTWIVGIKEDPCTSKECSIAHLCGRYDAKALPTQLTDKYSSSLNSPGERCFPLRIDMPIITEEEFRKALHDMQQSTIEIERDNFKEIVNSMLFSNHIPMPDDLYQKMKQDKKHIELGFDILMRATVCYLNEAIDALPKGGEE
jgi:hypothetical protein